MGSASSALPKAVRHYGSSGWSAGRDCPSGGGRSRPVDVNRGACVATSQPTLQYQPLLVTLGRVSRVAIAPPSANKLCAIDFGGSCHSSTHHQSLKGLAGCYRTVGPGTWPQPACRIPRLLLSRKPPFRAAKRCTHSECPHPPPYVKKLDITLIQMYHCINMVKTVLQFIPNILAALYGDGLEEAYSDGFTYFIHDYLELPAKIVRTK